MTKKVGCCMQMIVSIIADSKKRANPDKDMHDDQPFELLTTSRKS